MKRQFLAGLGAGRFGEDDHDVALRQALDRAVDDPLGIQGRARALQLEGGLQEWADEGASEDGRLSDGEGRGEVGVEHRDVEQAGVVGYDDVGSFGPGVMGAVESHLDQSQPLDPSVEQTEAAPHAGPEMFGPPGSGRSGEWPGSVGGEGEIPPRRYEHVQGHADQDACPAIERDEGVESTHAKLGRWLADRGNLASLPSICPADTERGRLRGVTAATGARPALRSVARRIGVH